MTASTVNRTDLFYVAIAAVVIIVPLLLVFAAGLLPEGSQRGELIVFGHGAMLAVVAVALVLRAAYAVGFRKGLKLAVPERNYPVTA